MVPVQDAALHYLHIHSRYPLGISKFFGVNFTCGVRTVLGGG